MFDLDGTVIDSLADLSAAANHALTDFGYQTHKEEVYKQYLGHGARELARLALPEDARTDELVDKLLERYNAIYREHCFDKTCVFPGMLELMAKLKTHGIALGVVTNKNQVMVNEVVKRFFPPDTFGTAIGISKGTPPKPDPFIAIEAAKAVGVPITECVMIGDTDMDYYTAKNAGMLPIMVTWGFRTRAELEAIGAPYIVDTAEQIWEILKQHM